MIWCVFVFFDIFCMFSYFLGCFRIPESFAEGFSVRSPREIHGKLT